ncbi:epoxyqueuosine reductase QueH [Thiocystis violascens]|nr:epoxyqueuosine reductase QueH [Thiocystis violascens]
MPHRPPLMPPGDADRVLLHSCCAPCSSAIVECLLNNGIRPTVFYFNPNIHPRREYERRKAESQRHAQTLGLDFVDADYDPKGWLKRTAALADAPERGPRCVLCFGLRLSETARYASANGFGVFTTTLASSRWKDRSQILDAGRSAAADWPGLVFWEHDWRKGGLTERKAELNREYGFYQQTYCGCIYSLRATRLRRVSDGSDS